MRDYCVRKQVGFLLFDGRGVCFVVVKPVGGDVYMTTMHDADTESTFWRSNNSDSLFHATKYW